MSGVYLTGVRLEQYRSFKSLNIQLPDGPGVLVVHGSNGIGKSSLFDGLEWALTDKIDHFRGADGVKKVGSYLCRWREGAPGPTTVTMEFSGDNIISRTLSSPEATKSVTSGNIGNITEFLRGENWKRSISGLSSYLLLTHFLGQSTISRLTNRDPSERFDILKEAAESKEIEDIANALHGRGNTRASRAYSGRIRTLNDEASTLQGLLDTEADLWSGLTGLGAVTDEAATQLARAISRLLDAAAGIETPSAVAFNQGTIVNLEDRLAAQRSRLRTLEASVEKVTLTLAAWDNSSRQSLEHEAAKATADEQVAQLTTERRDITALLELAKASEVNAATSAKNTRDALGLLIELRDVLEVAASTGIRKDATDAAVAAARNNLDRESAIVEVLERRLRIVRRIEEEVGRLDERGKLAQRERQNVALWLARDARVAELRSSIRALQLRFPNLDADIERAEGAVQDFQNILSEQNDILVELRKSVTAMSSAVASIVANLPNDACDCPVCATHFEVKGELHSRASSAATRLAPLVLAPGRTHSICRAASGCGEWPTRTTSLSQGRPQIAHSRMPIGGAGE
ncbi:AAA family ATPase [Bradyrhizobium sp. BR 1433]|uniref:AAA family ATPase n=1 Tax=Bradyrhizobium sp. BR 1433 TaxID=3447967 RepID=UPI003EE477C3